MSEFPVVRIRRQRDSGIKPLSVSVDGFELRRVRRVVVTHDATDVTEVTITLLGRLEYEDEPVR